MDLLPDAFLQLFLHALQLVHTLLRHLEVALNLSLCLLDVRALLPLTLQIIAQLLTEPSRKIIPLMLNCPKGFFNIVSAYKARAD